MDTLVENSGGLEVSGLSFSYAGRLALADISLAVPEGQFVCLLGSSGCGKTTLLRLLAGLERPAAGQVAWDGKELAGPSLERGVVFQDYSLFPWMTLLENVRLAVAKASPKLPKQEAKAVAEDYLGLVGLGGAGKKYPFELSGGMRQRGAIARALAVRAKALLMDEPFGALDPVNRAKLQDLLASVWASSSRRLTVVFVTHDVEEALLLGDRVVALGSSPGRVVADIQVPFERPRPRRALFASSAFATLCEEIEEVFRADMIRNLEAGETLKGGGEGI